MPLNELSLEELTELAGTLEQIRFAGADLAAAGLTPIFNLTPGQSATITLPFTMPKISEPSPVETFLANRAEYLNRQMAERLPPSTEAAPDAPGAEATDAPKASEPVPAKAGMDPPPAVEGPAGGDPIPSAPEQSAAGQPETIPPAASPQDDPLPVARAAEGSGGGAAQSSGSLPPAAPIPGSASALAVASGQKLWTEEEDDRLVAFVVEQVTKNGLTKAAALPLAAAALDRPVPGTEFRANRKLKDRINSAIFAAATRQAQTETPPVGDPPTPYADAALAHAEEIEDEPDPEPGERATKTDIPTDAPIVGQPADVDPLQKHLDELPRKDGWTLQRDFDLLDLATVGWQANEISLELGVQAKLIKPRLDLLTGLYTDDNTGKQIRRFRREAVRDALQARLTATGKAA